MSLMSMTSFLRKARPAASCLSSSTARSTSPRSMAGTRRSSSSLGKGEFFGEMAVIDGSARSATAIASAPGTRVMRINHARFVYLVSQQPAFALMVMDALSKRLRASNAVTYRDIGRIMSDRRPSPLPDRC